MTEPTTVEYFFAVNQDGDSVCSSEGLSDAVCTLQSDYGAEAVRTWSVTFTLTLPTSEALDVPLPISNDAREVKAVAS